MGYAVNYHGYARSTGDMDVWIGFTGENVERVARALQAFGFREATPEMLVEPGQVIRMAIPPLRLGILTSISGVDFDECFQSREVADIDGLSVPMIRLTDLLKNKRAARRLKDLADVEELQSRGRTRLETTKKNESLPEIIRSLECQNAKLSWAHTSGLLLTLVLLPHANLGAGTKRVRRCRYRFRC